VNALLFPAEVDRVLAPEGSVVWVNSSGDQTPIHLRSEEVAAVLPGEWRGVASRAGQGQLVRVESRRRSLYASLRWTTSPTANVRT
jgi:hypothetical protein